MRSTWLALLALGVGCTHPETAEAPAATRQAARAPDAHHWLLTIEVDHGAARLVTARSVEAPLPTLHDPEPRAWKVAVETLAGALLYETSIDAANLLRAEAGDEGHLVTLERFAFPLRVPALGVPSRVRVMDEGRVVAELALPVVAP